MGLNFVLKLSLFGGVKSEEYIDNIKRVEFIDDFILAATHQVQHLEVKRKEEQVRDFEDVSRHLDTG